MKLATVVEQLATLQPSMARVRREGGEADVAIAEVHAGDTVIVRPGERFPVDGVVAGFSRLFPMIDTDSAFSILLAQDAAGAGGHAIDLYLTDGPDATLRPLTLS